VETADPSAPAPLDIRQADRFYQPFPDFASWKGLTAADLDLWDRFAKGLEAQRAAAPPEAFGRAVEVAMRAAAIDTGAIEGLYDVDRGFTMSVATQAVAWEHAMEEKGADIRALFEAQLEAYELVLDAATRSRPVYEAWIRQLHEILCAAQDTYRVLTPSGWQEHELVKGQYKTLPNHVRLKDGSFHAYAPVDRVLQEMHRLVEILTGPEFEAAHPVLQASYAHYALVNVHPFADGNGRVARALASLYFYRAVSTPLVIFANQRLSYFDALYSADNGRLEPLIDLFRDRGIDTMQLLTEDLRAAMLPDLDTLVAEIKELPETNAWQIDAVTARIMTAIEQELGQQLDQIDLNLHTSILEDRFGGNTIHLSIKEPTGLGPFRDEFRININQGNGPFRFLLDTASGKEGIEVRLKDVSPELTDSFRLRLRNWIRSNLSQMLAELRDQAKNRSQSPS
jgi:Fic family protein